MSARKKTIRLKLSEIEHLLGLIDMRKEDGWWFGTKSKFEQRERRIKSALLYSINRHPSQLGAE